jgi:hypothetical protein
VFDEEKLTTKMMGSGMKPPSKNTPQPAVGIFSGTNNVNTDSGGGLMLIGSYRNLIVDFSSLKKPMKLFILGWEQSTGGESLGNFGVPTAGVKEIFVSPNDVVFPDQTRAMQADGPFVQLVITPGKPGKAGPIPADSVLVITRNGTEVSRSNFPGAGDYTVGMKRVRIANDVVSWGVEDKSGKVSYRSAIAFPVRGALPGVVEYTVEASSHPVPPGR